MDSLTVTNWLLIVLIIGLGFVFNKLDLLLRDQHYYFRIKNRADDAIRYGDSE